MPVETRVKYSKVACYVLITLKNTQLFKKIYMFHTPLLFLKLIDLKRVYGVNIESWSDQNKR